MGLDTQLIEDGTYFVVAADGEAAGFTVVEHVTETVGGTGVPLVRMRKHLP